MARRCSTICPPFDQDSSCQVVADPARFRQALDRFFRAMPELFPKAFAQGYTLKESRRSAKLGLCLRRARCRSTGESFTVRPSFALPYMAGWTDDVQGPLFLRSFGVPFRALARVFGRDPMYWYRLEISLGRPSIVGTTLRQATVPEHLLADEHHQPRDGAKNYIATTVGAGCCLGAALAPTAGAADLQAAYEVFKQEAHDVQPGYQPQTVSVDGWAATRQAWLTLFPLAVLLRCFLHGWLNIRSRGKLSGCSRRCRKRSGTLTTPRAAGVSRSGCGGCGSGRSGTSRRPGCSTRWRSCVGARGSTAKAYHHPEGHRTSNMLDRVMRSMSRYFEGGQHLHGSPGACARHCRAWALLYNFRPWGPEAERDNGGWGSPAERLNQHRYHDTWLHNLLVSASRGGLRR